jgi:hypothetical protein
MTAVQLNIFDADSPTAKPVQEIVRRSNRIIRPGILSMLTARTSRRDLAGKHSSNAELRAAFLRGEELTPQQAIRYGMQANSFHRAMFYLKREGFVFIKTPHKSNDKTYYSYKMDKENSSLGRAG